MEIAVNKLPGPIEEHGFEEGKGGGLLARKESCFSSKQCLL